MLVRNIAEEFKKLAAMYLKESQLQGEVAVTKMVTELENATPVDTGLARSSWEVNKTAVGFDVENTTEYIQYLNEGSSLQAPSHFIEGVALKYGKPVGTIVKIKD